MTREFSGGLDLVEIQQEVVFEGGCKNGWSGFGTGCAAYHSIFPVLTEAGEASSPLRHEEFNRSAIRYAISNRGGPPPEILILGTATAELPLMARQEIDRNNIDACMTVADICRTPLRTCERAGLISRCDSTIQMDARVRDHYPETDFMGIFTDAFLTRFTPEERVVVLQNIVGVMHPDGILATTWRIGDGGYGTPNEKAEFVDRVVGHSVRVTTFSDILTIVSYADTMTSTANGMTIEDIKAFMKRFFRDVRVEESQLVYDVTPRPYARIIAYEPRK